MRITFATVSSLSNKIHRSFREKQWLIFNPRRFVARAENVIVSHSSCDEFCSWETKRMQMFYFRVTMSHAYTYLLRFIAHYHNFFHLHLVWSPECKLFRHRFMVTVEWARFFTKWSFLILSTLWDLTDSVTTYLLGSYLKTTPCCYAISTYISNLWAKRNRQT